MRVSQCFYTAQEFSKSVSLAVTQSDPGSSVKRSANAYWEEMFGRFNNEEKEKTVENESDKEKKESLREQRQKGEEEEKGPPPKKISGVRCARVRCSSTSVEMTRCQTWRAYRALKVCHIDRKLTLRPAEAGASSGPPMNALLTSKRVKFIGSEVEWVSSY